jgi:hypothetical protein
VRRLRDEVKETKKTFDKTEDDLKALQSMGQIIGEVLRQLDDEKCAIAPAVQTPRSSARPSPFFSPPSPRLRLTPPPPRVRFFSAPLSHRQSLERSSVCRRRSDEAG